MSNSQVRTFVIDGYTFPVPCNENMTLGAAATKARWLYSEEWGSLPYDTVEVRRVDGRLLNPDVIVTQFEPMRFHVHRLDAPHKRTNEEYYGGVMKPTTPTSYRLEKPMLTAPTTSVTLTYEIECPSCCGSGETYYTNAIGKQCKACSGTGVVTVTEVRR